jgi:hypothetical protein
MIGLRHLGLFALATITQGKWIVPGARWRDTNGGLVNAHAGGVTVDHVTGRYFWFGEYKIEGQEEGGGISVYSSDDLATWKNEGIALGKLPKNPHLYQNVVWILM